MMVSVFGVAVAVLLGTKIGRILGAIFLYYLFNSFVGIILIAILLKAVGVI